MTHEVFISYAREDIAQATLLVEALSACGVRCWIDRDTIAHAHGSEWSAEISAAIGTSKALLLLLSPDSNQSKFVAAEVHIAFERDVPILPVRLQDVTPGDRLALYLSRIQWLDAFPIFESHVHTISNRIIELVDAEGVGGYQSAEARSVSFGRRMSGYLGHLTRRGRREPDRQAAAVQTAGSAKASRTEADADDPDRLAAAGRWWRLKTLVEERERSGRPLRRLEPYRDRLRDQLARFDDALKETERRFERLGPRGIADDVSRLHDMISDHPALERFGDRVGRRASDVTELRQIVNRLRTQGRWLAVENHVRRFVIGHRQQSPSLIEAARISCERAVPEARRLLLLAWAVLVTPLLAGGIGFAAVRSGALDGDFAARLADVATLRRLLADTLPTLVVGAVIVVAIDLLLSVARRGGTSRFTGTAMGAIAAAVLVQAIPAVLNGLGDIGSEYAWRDALGRWAAGAWGARILAVLPAFAAMIGFVFVFAAATRRWLRTAASPRLGTAWAASLVGAISLLSMGPGDAGSAAGVWLQWFPAGGILAGVLMVGGLLQGRLAWWLVAGGVSVAGAIAAATGVAASSEGILRTAVPVLIACGLAGAAMSRLRTPSGYLGIAVAAAFAALVFAICRSIDAGVDGVPIAGATMLALASSIGLAECARADPELQEGRLSIHDGLAKVLLLIRSLGSTVQGGWLTDSAWFADASRESSVKRPTRPSP